MSKEMIACNAICSTVIGHRGNSWGQGCFKQQYLSQLHRIKPYWYEATLEPLLCIHFDRNFAY